MREVDRIMVEELHIELVQMMENAGRSLAEQARRMLGGDARGARVGVLAGRGGNGGGGLTAGRRRSIWGADVSVILGGPRQQVITSGGATAFLNLAIYLVERFGGQERANLAARVAARRRPSLQSAAVCRAAPRCWSSRSSVCEWELS